MTLETLPGDKGSRQKRKRVGRGPGSGLGKTSGRGHKGAGSRAGVKHKSTFEGGQMPLYRRVPKRGFFNRFRVETQVVNLASLEKKFTDGQTVEIRDLAETRLIADPKGRVKILGTGELSKKLTIRAHAFSTAARRAIEERGGSCEVVEC
ncbi:MAG: 50S ribosomal protein L15 [Candidatus Sumerlaeota bacterium]|nr:50S ribosomal protein L15 [Candidatus Sumerlaeota bacterium]